MHCNVTNNLLIHPVIHQELWRCTYDKRMELVQNLFVCNSNSQNME